MASSVDTQGLVSDLVQQATAKLSIGEFEGAKRQLQEASTLDAGNDKVRAAWQELEERQEKSPLVDLCARWVKSLSDDDGEEVLDFLSSHDVSDQVAEKAMDVMLQYSGDLDMADQIGGMLLRRAGARKALASEFTRHPTETFRKLWEYGNDSIDGLTTTLFSQGSWPSQVARIAASRDVFQLALAELMQAGTEHPERAMKVVSRLLAVEASNLNGIIDSDGFDVILDRLEISLPASLRSQATIAISRLLELSPDSGQTLIANYVTSKVMRPTITSLVHAFSAASAVFPMSPKVSAELFLSEGFLSAFVPMIRSRKSERVELAALELLSAACVDKACREGIAKFCRDWLEETAQNTRPAKRASLAGLVLVKIQDEAMSTENSLSSNQPSPNQEVNLVNNFKRLVLADDNESKVDAIEGLAYSSLKPAIKENLANDQALLIKLIKVLSAPKHAKSELFGGLTIFAHLTVYRPPMSEEQQKISQLKSYANAQKPNQTDPLNEDRQVSIRCRKVLDAGIVPLLVTSSKGVSPTILALVVQIIFSLSQEQKHRGVMSQQGAVKLLLHLYDHLEVQPAQKSGSNKPTIRMTAHALARILISVNPKHVFQSQNALITPIRPLVSLLSTSDEDSTPLARPAPTASPPLLATFEGLLALTNLASVDSATADAVVRASWSAVEDLLLSSNTLVQRAAVELVCNLCTSPEGISKFGDGTPQAATRLHILLALADMEDLSTRRAAGGALAMLTEWKEVVEAVLKRDRGVKALVGLCGDAEGDEIRHRGLVCVNNMVLTEAPAGGQAREAVKKENGKEVIVQALKETRSPDLLQLGISILKALE